MNEVTNTFTFWDCILKRKLLNSCPTLKKEETHTLLANVNKQRNLTNMNPAVLTLKVGSKLRVSWCSKFVFISQYFKISRRVTMCCTGFSIQANKQIKIVHFYNSFQYHGNICFHLSIKRVTHMLRSVSNSIPATKQTI